MRVLVLVAAVALAGLAVYLYGDAGEQRNRRGERVERHDGQPARALRPEAGPQGAGASAGEAAKRTPAVDDTWRVRFVGRDGETVFPKGLARKHGQQRIKLETNDDGWYRVPPGPLTLVYRTREFAVPEPGLTIQLDEFVPFALVLADPDDGAPLFTLDSHVDVLAGLDDYTLKLEGRIVPPWRTWAHLSRAAGAVRGIVPAWKEADVRVRVSGPDGAEAGAMVESAFFGGKFVGADDEISFYEGASGYELQGAWGTSDNAGFMRVRGVPLIDGEVLKLVVGRDDRVGSVSVRLRRGAVAKADVALSGEQFWIPMEEEVSGGIGVGISDRRSAEYGSLTVRAFRNDGRPAVNAGIALHCGHNRYFVRTDEDGVAVLPKVMVAEYVVALKEPGLLYTEAIEPIRKGVKHVVTLTEPVGWSFELRVVDDRGLPVPFASVHASPAGKMGYVRVVDGVQWVDHYTGPDGTLRVGPLPPGDVGIRVRYGTRTATAKVKPSQSSARVRLPKAQ
ncbi:MAG: hypothetical protein ACYTGN_11010 [Planctomycetota bacterium]